MKRFWVHVRYDMTEKDFKEFSKICSKYHAKQTDRYFSFKKSKKALKFVGELMKTFDYMTEFEIGKYRV